MKRSCRPLGMLCVALGVMASAVAQVAPAPKLVLSQDSWNFGEVWHPQPATVALVVKNEGTADLKLGKVQTSCGCTLASPGRDVIPPGQSTEIRIRFDTEGKQGEVSSKVTIPSNDPTRPVVEFKVQGVVKRVITRTPLGGLVIRAIDTKPGLTGTVRLENQMPEPMQLKLLSNNLNGLEVEIKEITPGKVYDVIGKTTREFKPGTITRGTLLFSTGLQREERLPISARVEIKARVDPVPPAILLDAFFDQKPGSRIVSLQYYGTGKFEVTGAESTSPEVKVTEIGVALPPSGGMETILPKITSIVQTRIAVPAVDKLPEEGAVVVFKTSDPESPKVEVLVTRNRAAWELKMYGPPEEPLKSAP